MSEEINNAVPTCPRCEKLQSVVDNALHASALDRKQRRRAVSAMDLAHRELAFIRAEHEREIEELAAEQDRRNQEQESVVATFVDIDDGCWWCRLKRFVRGFL